VSREQTALKGSSRYCVYVFQPFVPVRVLELRGRQKVCTGGFLCEYDLPVFFSLLLPENLTLFLCVLHKKKRSFVCVDVV
jgi:hypothetical protein